MRGWVEPMTRRDLLRALVAGAALGALSRCATSPSPEEIRSQAAAYDPSLDCSDAAGLWPAERKTRDDNRYRDRSVEPLRYCFRCDNFLPPPVVGTCGACRTVKGPIHPLGWCTAWTERRA
jgi:hypothetical protein